MVTSRFSHVRRRVARNGQGLMTHVNISKRRRKKACSCEVLWISRCTTFVDSYAKHMRKKSLNQSGKPLEFQGKLVKICINAHIALRAEACMQQTYSHTSAGVLVRNTGLYMCTLCLHQPEKSRHGCEKDGEEVRKCPKYLLHIC